MCTPEYESLNATDMMLTGATVVLPPPADAGPHTNKLGSMAHMLLHCAHSDMLGIA